MKTLTRAEVAHITDVLDDYEHLITSYPEIVTDHEEDKLKIVREIMEHEDS